MCTRIRRALPRVMLLTQWRVFDFNELTQSGWPPVDPSQTALLEHAPEGFPMGENAGGTRCRATSALTPIPKCRSRSRRLMVASLSLKVMSGIRGGGGEHRWKERQYPQSERDLSGSGSARGTPCCGALAFIPLPERLPS